MEIAAQVFGILAFIASVISYQLKTYRNILWTQLVCALLFVTHFFLLWQSGRADAITGAALNGVCAVRYVVLLLKRGRAFLLPHVRVCPAPERHRVQGLRHVLL